MNVPLASRMRPKNLSEFVGQDKLIGEDGIIRQMIAQGQCPSMIFWGNPGVGKTTLALLIANALKRTFYSLSAVDSGIKQLKEVIEASQTNPSILFIDEIHRFNKTQQDALLKAVEAGVITLICATTENPSFEVNNALLSRCQVYQLEPLSDDNILNIIQNALNNDEYLKQFPIEIKETRGLLALAQQDARRALNLLEIFAIHAEKFDYKLTDNALESLQISNLPKYDKNSEFHYDIISAFIKSMRGSDPDAALFWLAKLIVSGEKPEFITRRMIIFASEDVGLANPNALLLANAAMQAVSQVGWPESRIILSQAVIYLATSPKSNSAYLAIDKAIELAKAQPEVMPDLHLRNAPTKLMKDIGYGQNYLYPHNYPNHYIDQVYLPEALKNPQFYYPSDTEKNSVNYKFISQIRPERYPKL
ncbi:MAG: replication-associated recombination protein A [Chitinophagales bacterium]|jgi:putative ATPase|nr:replication-associated recombination protein A [Chitinophagales bacterium]